MTSARRAARAAGRAAPVVSGSAVSGPVVSPELLDADSRPWHHQADYVRYMKRQSWPLPPSERMGVPTSASNRRREAAASWARENGVKAEGHSGVDWHRLRAWGLV